MRAVRSIAAGRGNARQIPFTKKGPLTSVGDPSSFAAGRRPFSGQNAAVLLMKYPGSATKAKNARLIRVNALMNFMPFWGYSRT